MPASDEPRQPLIIVPISPYSDPYRWSGVRVHAEVGLAEVDVHLVGGVGAHPLAQVQRGNLRN
jgi:hypothetical protein